MPECGCELTHGIEQQDIHFGSQLTSSCTAEPSRLDDLLDFTETFRMAWSDEQRQILVLFSKIRKDVENLLFFSRHRARGDPEPGYPRQDSGELRSESALHYWSVVLQIPKHGDLAPVCANGFDALAISFGLHSHERRILGQALVHA